MRHRSGVLRLAVLIGTCLCFGPSASTAGLITRLAQQAAAPPEVDLALVLAVDVSFSMDSEEQAVQRQGYIEAITSKEFLGALRDGPRGKIAMTYFEWANTSDQRVIVPWRLIEGPESADGFVAELARAPYRRAARTSISGALEFGADLLDKSGYAASRRVIDVSGDGANNNGRLVTSARDDVLAKGIVINGLPIMVKIMPGVSLDIANLDVYYEDCVVGGPGSFVLPIKERGKFKQAIREKLVQEVAAREPTPRMIPASASAPRVSCTIGEQLWQERWGN